MLTVNAGAKSNLAPGSAMEVEALGRTLAIRGVDGEIHAVDGIGPHRGGPLGHGELHGRVLTCPWRMWEWDCRTEVNVHNPAQAISVYRPRIEDGDILVQVY